MAKSNAERQREYRRRRRDQREVEVWEELGRPANWHPDAQFWGCYGNMMKQLKRREYDHYSDHPNAEPREGCPWCADEQ